MKSMDDSAVAKVIREGPRIVVTGIGTMDLHNSKAFQDALVTHSASADYLAVDLRDALFIDTAVVASVAVAARNMLRRGRRLQVYLSKGTHPLRTLTIAGFDTVMDMLTDPKEIEPV